MNQPISAKESDCYGVAQHTPGPWRIVSGGWSLGFDSQPKHTGGSVEAVRVDLSRGYFTFDKDGKRRERFHEDTIHLFHFTLQDQSRHRVPIDEMLANARLAAAAPVLLKACQQAIAALKGREHDGFLRDAVEAATGSRP